MIACGEPSRRTAASQVWLADRSPEPPRARSEGAGPIWQGLFAPAGTDSGAINKLNHEVNESLRSPEMTATLAKLGYESKITTPEEFASFLAAELKKWPPLLRAAGLKAQ